MSLVAWRSVDSCLFVMVVPQSGWYTPHAEKSPGISSQRSALTSNECTVDSLHLMVFQTLCNHNIPRWDYSKLETVLSAYLSIILTGFPPRQPGVALEQSRPGYIKALLILLTPVLGRVHHVVWGQSLLSYNNYAHTHTLHLHVY